MQKGHVYRLSARNIAAAVKAGKISAQEIAAACAARIKHLDGKVKAMAYFDLEKLMQQAALIDRKRKAGKALGSLAGVPVGVKDIFNTHDMPTCMGSPLWQGFTPGNDARCVFTLRQADALIAGKTVTAEFAVHEPGSTRNPYNLNYYPGTSSSGSAVAVAIGMMPLSLGTQTAGSIIRPASYCGVYGFKPTFGLIPRTGVLKTNDTLDQIGWFARNIDDIELMFETIRVRGQNYPFVYERIDKKEERCFERTKWKVAFVEHAKWEYVDAYAQGAFNSFKDSLSGLRNITAVRKKLPPCFKQAHRIHEIIYNKTLAYYFEEEYNKKHLVSKVLCGLIQQGRKIPASEYIVALEQQVVLRDALESLFDDVDIIVTLSTSGQAPLLSNPIDKPDSCLIWNLCGVPVANVPMFKGPQGLPFGLQVVARRYNDTLVFNFIKMLKKYSLCKDLLPINAGASHE